MKVNLAVIIQIAQQLAALVCKLNGRCIDDFGFGASDGAVLNIRLKCRQYTVGVRIDNNNLAAAAGELNGADGVFAPAVHFQPVAGDGAAVNLDMADAGSADIQSRIAVGLGVETHSQLAAVHHQQAFGWTVVVIIVTNPQGVVDIQLTAVDGQCTGVFTIRINCIGFTDRKNTGVPLVIAGPGFGGGRVISEPVAQLDLAATVAAVTGTVFPVSAPSTDLSGMICDVRGIPASGVLWRESGDLVSVVSGSRKVIWAVEEDSLEAYDILLDPGETVMLEPWEDLVDEALYYWATPPVGTAIFVDYGESVAGELRNLGYIR